MFAKTKRLKSNIAKFLVLIMIVATVFASVSAIEPPEVDPVDFKYDYTPTMEDEFLEDRIIVTLKHKHSEINKEINASEIGIDFERHGVEFIRDMPA